MVLALLILGASAARAQVERHIGTPIERVLLRTPLGEVTDPQVLELVETVPGRPLSLVQVRETIAHLVTLGLYEDVVAEVAAGERGLDLVYRLTPLRVIASITFEGSPQVGSRRLRQAIAREVGPAPPARRLPEIVAAIETALAAEGYLRPSIVPRLGRPGRDGRTPLVVTVAAGPRAVIGRVTLDTDQDQAGRARTLAELRLEPGAAWNAAAAQRRADRFAARLRELGYYEARVDIETRVHEGGATVDLAVLATRGPLVELVFEGDPLPRDRQQALVPLAREGAVDEDLLEDSKRRVESYLRQQGYWQATADYARESRDGRLRVVFTIRKGRAAVVLDVVITGAQGVQESELRAALRTLVGAPFVRAVLELDVAAIAQRYRTQGFAGVRVTALPEPVAGAPAGAGTRLPVTVRIRIEEGPQTRIGEVLFTGHTSLLDAELRALVKAAPGAPYYGPQLLADRDALLLAHQNRGYRQAAVTLVPRPDAAGTRVEVTFDIVAGARALIDHVIVVGNTRTSAETIAREVQLSPGDPVAPDALAAAQRRLGALGLFRRVRVEDVGIPGETTRDVIVSVEEAPATRIGYGGGLEAGRELVAADTPDGAAEERIAVAPSAFFEIGRRNLWGKNRSINFFSRVSVRRDLGEDEAGDGGFAFTEYRVVGNYREPRVIGGRVDLQASAFAEQAVRASFDYRRRGITADLTRRAGPYTLYGRYSLGQTDTFNERYNPEEQPLIDRLFPQVRLSVLSGGLVYDTRDDPLDPGRGYMASTNSSLAARALGSEVGYVKSLNELFVYRRLPTARRVVFAGGVRVGLAAGFERTVEQLDENGDPVLGPDGAPIVEVVDDLPASERFYAGGDTTVRGFALDRLGDTGTIDEDGFPTGGNGLLILNAEVRFPVWRAVGGAVFVDAGNVFLRTSDIDLTRIRGAVGAGIRYRSPIGPIRVDVGVKLSTQVSASGTREKPYVVHISLGQAF
jgi:outer membrane protein assembly factor BamA